MSKKLLFAGLIVIGFALIICNSAAPEIVQSQIKTGDVSSPTPQPNWTPPLLAPEIQLPSGGKVEFKGVSFNYNPKIFGEVKAGEVAEYALENETDKPENVEPQHVSFIFDLATPYSPMEIAVFPINDFPRMYAVNKDSVKAMEKEIINLKKILKDKNFRTDKQMPFLPFRDARQTFQVKVRHYNFQNGKGILFLTFWETEFELPSNRQLRYVFEGLTNDEKYYVLAEMPISVTFLEDTAQEYEGYKVPWGKFNDKAEMKRFDDVEKKIAKRLEKLPPEKYEPNLKRFEEIISSLKIEK